MFFLLPALLSGLPVWAGEPDAAPVVLDRVAASVNDEIVTLSEIYAVAGDYIAEIRTKEGELAARAAEREVLEGLISQILIDQEIEAQNLLVTEEELDRTIDDIARRNGLSREQLRIELSRQGMSWDQYREQLKSDMNQMRFAQVVLRPRVNITDDELKDAYNRLGATAPKLAHVQAIFLGFPAAATEEQKAAVIAQARALKTEAEGGADFAALSATHDQAGFGAQGGDMGRFKPGDLVGDLDKAVFNTAPGTIAEPVITDRGVFLIRVVALERDTQDFEAVREQLLDQVFQSRMAEEQERWYQQARAKASIRILLP
jgi:peptidyl-prolyl cis-trans isomerase SurA